VDRDGLILALFRVRRALIGCIHVQALPGTPRGTGSLGAIAEAAVRDARAYQAAGFHGLILENMHDRPYLKRGVGPEVVAAMTVVAQNVRAAVALPLGVQILAGANREAIAVAHAAGAVFVRAEGFVFAHVADEGIIEADAGTLLRYRHAIGADAVRVFADVKKKHSAHALTADVDLADTAHAAEFFLADAIVVTGAATGRPTDPEEVRTASAATALPTLVGSGTTAQNIGLYPEADGFIVGTWVKQDGLWTNPVDPRRAEVLARILQS
jgi:membrane complex biogenesis BtpA family protein